MSRRRLACAAAAVAVLAAAGGGTYAAFTDATSAHSSFAADADFLPVVDSVPDISRSPRDGETVSVSSGDWRYAPDSYAYQWLRCSTAGSSCVNATGTGATTAIYSPEAADAGSTLRVDVRAANGAVTTEPSRTEATDVVQGVLSSEPYNVDMPTIAVTGSTYTADTGTWTGFGVNQLPEYRWEWLRCDSTGASCSAIAGTQTGYTSVATTNSYTKVAADSGRRLRAKVTAKVIGLNNPAFVLTADTAVVP